MPSDKTIAIVIPARYGSTRFPGKPLVQIAGRSLVNRVHDQALSCREAGSVWVATDDRRIEAHVSSFGGRSIMTDSALSSGTDRIAAALSDIEGQLSRRVDFVVNLQGDEPLIDTESVDRLIRELSTNSDDVATLACQLEDPGEAANPDVVKVVTDLENRALYFSRAAIPHGSLHLARRHIGIYGYSREALVAFSELEPSPLEKAERLEQLRLLENGYTIRVLRAGRPSPGVDRPDDVARIERLLSSR